MSQIKTHSELVRKTQNITSNLTKFAFCKQSPLPTAHTYIVIDHNGECVDEFSEWEEATSCYLNQSPETLVGAWLIYGVCMVPVH